MQPTLPRHEYTLPLRFRGWGKNWAGPFFPHPDKVKHQPYAEGYQVEENLLCIWLMGRGKTQLTLRSQKYAKNLKLLVRGWGKTGPAHSFPTLTRLNIDLV